MLKLWRSDLRVCCDVLDEMKWDGQKLGKLKVGLPQLRFP